METKMKTTKKLFGTMPDGRDIDLFTIINKNGMTVKVISYGGIITSLSVPDRDGKMDDVVLGFDDLSDYLNDPPYFGALIGRYGNRIAKGRFTLNGKKYSLAQNNENNHLHGGDRGFDKVMWDTEEFSSDGNRGLRLQYLSLDGEEGYPGNMSTTVPYTLTDDNKLIIDYLAVTDSPTPVNLTHHSYFNLNGMKNDILDHELEINADRFTDVNDELIPTGDLITVKNTSMDFTSPVNIGSGIKDVPNGYDHNYVLNNTDGSLSPAATLYEKKSRRFMEVFTTEPGMQFYSGNFLDGNITGKNKISYNKHWGVCLEAQHFPDSPNQPSFPTTILNPGEKYKQQTIYKFSVKR